MDKIISRITGIKLDKFYNPISYYRQSFLQWFYHSFCFYFHLNILIIYLSSITIYPMIRCQHNSHYENVFIDHYCLFNSTYLIDYRLSLSSSERLYYQQTWFSNIHSNDIQPNQNSNDDDDSYYYYSIRFHHYYPHLIAIFTILLSINFMANFIRIKMNSFHRKLLYDDRCRYFHCKIRKRKNQKQKTRKMKMKKPFICLKYYHCLLIFFDTESIIMIGLYFQILILNFNFNQDIFWYGFRIFNYYIFTIIKNDNVAENVFELMFPIFTKCSIRTFGTSGMEIHYDGLCQLRYNYFNRITFTLIWLIYFFIIIFILINFFKKILIISSKYYRQSIIISKLLNNDDDEYDDDSNGNDVDDENRIDRETLKIIFRKHMDLDIFITINCLIEQFGSKRTKQILSIRPFFNNNDNMNEKEIALLEMNDNGNGNDNNGTIINVDQISFNKPEQLQQQRSLPS